MPIQQSVSRKNEHFLVDELRSSKTDPAKAMVILDDINKMFDDNPSLGASLLVSSHLFSNHFKINRQFLCRMKYEHST